MLILQKRLPAIPRGWLRASIVVLISFTSCVELRAQEALRNASAILPTEWKSVKLFDQPVLPAAPADAAIGFPAAVPVRLPLPAVREESRSSRRSRPPRLPIPWLISPSFRWKRPGSIGSARNTDYFPKLSSTLTNFHFNKFMGQEITIQRPVAGGTITAGLPLAGKDQTLVALTAAQPVTPLLKLREVVNIARADERLAMAKAGMPVENASNVEKSYYELLVAQRQLLVAKANTDSLRNKQLLASNAPTPALASVHEDEEITRAKALIIADSKVKELTASLNLLLGYPADTELELVPPLTEMEDISFKEASDKAMAANPEVVEAESNVAKAHAASRLSKFDYIPDVAVLGGYAYNDNAIPLLPRDFSFIGIMGSYTVFDFGKREHTIKERNAQVGMAETALALTKAKVAAAVKTSYFEMDRSRQLSELARRMSAVISIRDVSYRKDDPDQVAAQAKVDIEIFQANLEYRQALAQLKTLMGTN